MTSRRTLSSSKTFLLKFIIPTLWIGGFGAGVSTLWFGDFMVSVSAHDPELKWIFLFVWLAGSAFIWITSARNKRVRADGQNLYISNYLGEIAVPFSEIERVSEFRWVRGHPITVRLRSDTAFGRVITFLPTSRLFGFWSSHPVVAELRGWAGHPPQATRPSPEPGSLIRHAPGFSKLRNLLASLNSVAPLRFLVADIGIACFFGLPYCAALFIAPQVPPWDTRLRAISLYGIVPASLLVILTAVVGLAWNAGRTRILALHGTVFLIGVAALVFWTLDLVIEGIPRGAFGWTPGLLEASVGYALFLICRFVLPASLRTDPRIYYVPIFGAFLAIPLDIGVMVRFAQMIWRVSS
jgi:hypothetical protein